MIRFIRAAMRGVRAELAAGESGWVSLTDQDALSVIGRKAHSGQTVSAESVMCLSAAWSCVNRTATLIGSMPGALYERGADGKRTRIDNDLSAMLGRQPNQTQTGMEYWEGGVAQTLLQGNSYSEKMRIGRRLVGLRPIFNVTPKRTADGGWEYHHRENGRVRVLASDDVFHMRGFGAGDGLGMSAIRHGVHSFGAALAADEAAGMVYANGLMTSGVLKSGQTLNEEQRGQLQTLMGEFIGSKMAGKILTLEGGLEFQQLMMNPEDAQLLETRRFQVEDICRWFGVPPIIIGHAGEGQTMWGSGVEAIMLAWLTNGINPLLKRIEARILRDLIPPEKRRTWYWEWNREAMLQMDSKAKAEFLSKMTTSGIMSRDEGRTKLNLPTRGGAADELFAQTALAPLDDLGTKGNET